MGDHPTISAQLMALGDFPEARTLATWAFPVGGVSSKGDDIVVDDEVRRIIAREWRGPYLVRLLLSDPLPSSGYPYTGDGLAVVNPEETPHA